MNINNIIKTKQILEKNLQYALSTMEKKETIYEIQNKIKENQARCPHFDNNYILDWINNTCPYCGKKNCKNPKEEL